MCIVIDDTIERMLTIGSNYLLEKDRCLMNHLFMDQYYPEALYTPVTGHYTRSYEYRSNFEVWKVVLFIARIFRLGLIEVIIIAIQSLLSFFFYNSHTKSLEIDLNQVDSDILKHFFFNDFQ